MKDFLWVMAWVVLVFALAIGFAFLASAIKTSNAKTGQQQFKECLQQGASPEYCFKVAD